MPMVAALEARRAHKQVAGGTEGVGRGQVRGVRLAVELPVGAATKGRRDSSFNTAYAWTCASMKMFAGVSASFSAKCVLRAR
eukprot:CAMPEP_0177685688 /NCGR_PEP_ID=MMETSP0447-20121125/33165_1 /TAXON_ID=0 /ORGANISM="Stygamoeba regulata, Strain BSH-02190019" /LENGTH=81 /DNA_ID=CAMNT_0019195753 /DNA_START=1196 /DNA_END=1442 /DNA_ORIENTATION=-